MSQLLKKNEIYLFAFLDNSLSPILTVIFLMTERSFVTGTVWETTIIQFSTCFNNGLIGKLHSILDIKTFVLRSFPAIKQTGIGILGF